MMLGEIEYKTLIAHAAATWLMLGVIWLIQLCVYPLFSKVGTNAFHDYYAHYKKKIAYVVTLPMTVELVTGFFILKIFLNTDKAAIAFGGLIFILIIWTSTCFLQIPQHAKLEQGFCHKAGNRLLRSNWIRTTLWTVRGFLVLFLVF